MIYTFSKVDNEDGTSRIECRFIVYRALFGHHPDWLPQDEEDGKKNGFYTKFWFLVEDDIPSSDIDQKLDDYIAKYDTTIREIENDDSKWDKFPFKDKPITYKS